MKLYLVRHGASTGNTPGNLIGHSDHPLTPAGEAQARAAAARLAPLGPMPIFCSDLPRARATAGFIADAWTKPDGLPDITPDPRLREIHLGDYEGHSWDEFQADAVLMAAFEEDPYSTSMPNGESLGQLVERAMGAVNEIVAAAGAGEPDALAAVCIVAHDGPIRAVINQTLGVPPDKWWTVSTTHGGLSLLEWAEDWVNVRFVNDTSHLAGLADVEPGIL
jgi:glucosyl-3-phosphoglycerate phosphatase